MTFLRNDFSKIFDILFTTPIYREDAYLSSNDELKIKAKDLRLKLMAVKCSIPFDSVGGQTAGTKKQ